MKSFVRSASNIVKFFDSITVARGPVLGLRQSRAENVAALNKAVRMQLSLLRNSEASVYLRKSPKISGAKLPQLPR